MPRIGVCSWTLRPQSPDDLAARIRACGVTAVQLALDPIRKAAAGWDERSTEGILRQSGIRIVSGMMGTVGEDYSTLDSIRRTGGLRSDEHWPANLEAARANAAIAQRLGLRLVTLHAGFLPHEPGDELRSTMIARLRQIADAFAERGIEVGLETGQEDATTLLGVLQEIGRGNLGVNFDPANMILYGMGEPVDALHRLASWVKQVHIKDAIPTTTPGEWGTEVAVGTGAVDWARFFGIVQHELKAVNLLIEREAREDRVNDVRTAAELVRRFVG
ncbi:MAG: sugar phosphate isomerase/epimerase family protein [Phycisphaerales bacterium]